MAYLFISFADRLDKDISTKNELFGDSLRSQFNNLQKRIPLRRQTNNFQRFIEKINEQFGADIGSADSSAIASVTKMLLDDPIVKARLKEYAKTNDINMFIKSIFPTEFQRVLVECFMQNDEAFNRLLNDANFQRIVMNIMANELYKILVTTEDKPDSEE